MVQKLEDTGLVARSYLAIFYADVENLKESLTGYRGMLLQYELQTGGADKKDTVEFLKTAEEKTKAEVIFFSNNIRSSVERCQIAADGITEYFKLDLKELTKHYETIIQFFSPPLEEVVPFVFKINKILTKSSIEKTLKEMETFYAQYVKK